MSRTGCISARWTIPGPGPCSLRRGWIQFYAQFIVTDTQGVESATELIPLHYPARKDAQQFDRELYRDEEVAIGLESIEVIRAESGSGLYFRFRIENNTNRTLGFFTADMALNRTTIDATNLRRISPIWRGNWNRLSLWQRSGSPGASRHP